MVQGINPFDILSGKVVQNQHGTFWFKEAGVNMLEDGTPRCSNLHREDGPAAEWSFGRKEWQINGKPHNLNGPAILGGDGSTEYWVNGKRHRVDGPAAIWPGGHEYWLDHVRYSKEKFDKKIKCMMK